MDHQQGSSAGSDPAGASLLDFALQYAGRGWPVFPLHGMIDGQCTCPRGPSCGRNAGKHPRIKGGFKAASTSPAVIEAWWRKWPTANIGLATGTVCVLDVDGPAGMHVLQLLVDEYGVLPETLVARTGGGLHLYFQAIEGARSSARGNLHVRAAGGYVVAPPSLHRSGRRYQWLNQAPIAQAPAWLAEWMRAGGDKGTNQDHKQVSDSFAHLGPVPAHLAARGGAPANLPALVDQGVPWSAHEEARLRSALGAIPAREYQTWVTVGMALHWLEAQPGWDTPDGWSVPFKLWNEWSATCPEEYAEWKCEEKWRSFGKRSDNARGVTVASVYHAAHEHGWAGIVTAVPTGVNSSQINGSGAPANFFAPLNATGSGNAIVFPDTDKVGRPKPTPENTRVGIKGMGICCEKDTFHEKVLVGGQPIAQWAGDLSDEAVLVIRQLLRRQFGFEPTTQNVQDACVQLALENQFNPILGYLDSLKWDGRKRLDTWLATYLRADVTPLNAAIGRLALVAAVRRVRRPGTKFDQVIVLEGAEYLGKSKAIQVLAGKENFSDQPLLNADDRSQQELMQGVWLYEIADLTGMARSEVERIKAFCSREVDRARPAYGRFRVDRPRTCVIFATTNDNQYLKSQTGNRRFWPVRCGKVDLDGLARDRDQLWAEAAAYEAAGESIWLAEQLWSDALAAQEDRRETDPWEDFLIYFEPKGVFPTVSGYGEEYRVATTALYDLLGLEPGKLLDAHSKRIGRVMRKLGWEGPVDIRLPLEPEKINGKTKSFKGYRKNKPL